MTFKISKKDLLRIEQLADDLGDRRAEIDKRIDEINEFITDKVGDLNILIAYYNEKLDEARGVVEDLHSEADSEFSDRSESWQDGDRGSITREWIEHLESIKDNDLNDITEFEIDDCEIALPDDVEDHRVILSENLEAEPNY